MARLLAPALLLALLSSVSAHQHYATCPRECPLPNPEHLVQFDGDGHGDAGDSCGQESHTLPLGGEISGMLVPPIDTVDAYLLPIPASRVGTTIQVFSLALLDETPATDHVLTVIVREPGCGNEVGRGAGGGVVLQCVVTHHGRLCTVPTLTGDSLTFTAQTAGDHTVLVTTTAPKQISPQGSDYCDPVCSRLVNAPVGYRVSAN